MTCMFSVGGLSYLVRICTVLLQAIFQIGFKHGVEHSSVCGIFQVKQFMNDNAVSFLSRHLQKGIIEC